MNDNAYRALRERAAYIDLTGRGNIRVAGEDRARLLHAMCTNNVEKLQPGTGCYAFFLTAQGRILADANIYCMPDYLLLDTEPGTKDRLMEHLDKYIIADDAWLEDFTADTAVINVEGPEAEACLKTLGAPAAHVPFTVAEWGHCFVTHATYTGGSGYSVMLPVEQVESLHQMLEQAGVVQATPEEADTVRLENGKPRFGIDFSEAYIPHETQQLQAVSFEKGCYLGQEIVERVRSRGQVNRRLVRLEFDSAQAPVPGSKIEAEGKDAGEVTSAAFSPALGNAIGLGYVRAAALNSPLTAGGFNGRVRPART